MEQSRKLEKIIDTKHLEVVLISSTKPAMVRSYLVNITKETEKMFQIEVQEPFVHISGIKTRIHKKWLYTPMEIKYQDIPVTMYIMDKELKDSIAILKKNVTDKYNEVMNEINTVENVLVNGIFSECCVIKNNETGDAYYRLKEKI